MSPPANSASPSWSPPKCRARSNTWARAKCCFPAICRCSPAGRARPALRAHRTRRLGLHATTTPTARCANISSCSRSMAAAWPNRPAAVGAAGAILHYLRETQRAALDHLDRPTYYDRADSMVLDAVTVRNLELVEPMFAADAGARKRSDSARRARSDADRHGRPAAAAAAAAAVAGSRRDRSAAGRGGRAAAADHPARRAAQAAGRHSRSGAAAGQGHARQRPARAICWRWAGRSRRFRR